MNVVHIFKQIYFENNVFLSDETPTNLTPRIFPRCMFKLAINFALRRDRYIKSISRSAQVLLVYFSLKNHIYYSKADTKWRIEGLSE